MYRLLCPDMTVNTLHEIDLNDLERLGICGIIFDLDNTIVPWNSLEMCPRITDWLNEVQARGFKVAIVSNNWQKRVKEIAQRFNLPFVSRAYKPAKAGFRRALAVLGVQPHQAAVVGDQLFTDILGGNRLGLYTIWVKPLTTKEFIGTRIHRQFEKLAVLLLRAKGLMK
ncbi:HAD superfamily (subfamily IIIA) phosphatase, TIGR01668 [Thermosinus carboxydivorans Nor1]|uniref:HAD superfamily (Subfamily IIIA) phosphatase, TIGR01668 n=1 Tax=Thermosinus carboxydivorans Nor1 TaxID=401526 RepID=A1HQ27_9FIRM|nr:YqeG family HAD IIIA-type phosphatase [Thermosinus carboxydivorans]EAX47876.1 HAD superfamily (subfamily IIIA) phosphatase, TIGR01668 [Thermosinus carboxydivorans Nor1]